MEKRKQRNYLTEAKHINANIQLKENLNIKENINCEIIEKEEEVQNSSVYENFSEGDNFNLRLAQWFCRNNISRVASNDLLMLLSEKIPNLMESYNSMFLNSSSGQPEPNFLKEIRDLLHSTQKKQDLLIAKVERLTAEMIGVRNDISAIKAKMQSDPISETTITPSNPFTTAEQFVSFEEVLQDENSLKTFISELKSSKEKSFEKFMRIAWRQIFSDELAQRYSWRGTQNKKCIRGSIVTLSVRTAFKQKYSLDDADFDKLTQKYFQHAHDRVVKAGNKIKTAN